MISISSLDVWVFFFMILAIGNKFSDFMLAILGELSHDICFKSVVVHLKMTSEG